MSVWSSCYTELSLQPVIPHHAINRGALSIHIPLAIGSTPDSTSVDTLEDLSPLTDLSDSDVEMDDAPDLPTSGPAIFSISTGFDSLHSQNRKVNFRSKDENERYEDTEQERHYAENAETVTSLQDLTFKVHLFLWYDIHQF